MSVDELKEIAIIIGFGFYGAVAHTLMSNKGKGKGFLAIIGLIGVNVLIAGFASLMAYFIALEIGLSDKMTYFLGGMAGFLGGKFLEVLESFAIKRLLDKMKVGSAEDANNSSND